MLPLSCVQMFQLKIKHVIREFYFIGHWRILLVTLSILKLTLRENIEYFQAEKY